MVNIKAGLVAVVMAAHAHFSPIQEIGHQTASQCDTIGTAIDRYHMINAAGINSILVGGRTNSKHLISK